MPPETTDAPELFPLITVRCFFDCGHAERDATPEAAHSGMERHYSERHADDVEHMLRRHIYLKPERKVTDDAA